MKILNWFKRFFGFGEKKTIAIDIETGGFSNNTIFVTEGYKVEHNKHHEAMQDLLKKIEDNKRKQSLRGGESMVYNSNFSINLGKKNPDGFDKSLDNFKETLDKHYSRPIEHDTSHDTSFIDSMVIGALTDSTVAGTILGGNPLGAMVGDMLNTSDETPSEESEDYSYDDDNYSSGNDYESPSYDDYSSGNDSDYSNDSYDDSSTRYDD